MDVRTDQLRVGDVLDDEREVVSVYEQTPYGGGTYRIVFRDPAGNRYLVDVHEHAPHTVIANTSRDHARIRGIFRSLESAIDGWESHPAMIAELRRAERRIWAVAEDLIADVIAEADRS